MVDQKTSKETMTMSTLSTGARSVGRRRGVRLVLALTLSLAVTAAFAGPALSSESITAFSVITSSTQAGGHPNLTASFTLKDPGQPEAAKNISANLPEGVFGNPGGIVKCPPADFVLSECSPDSQAGIITVYANYDGNPNFLLGTAPVYNMVRVSEDEDARLAFVAPTVDVPVAIPVTVRTGSDYGLRMTVSGIPQLIPVSHVDITVWGLPATTEHEGERFKKGAPGEPPGCPGLADASCNLGGVAAGQLIRPYTHNPSACTGEELPVSLDVQTYQDPNHKSSAAAFYPQTTGCEKQTFKPVFNAGLTTNETDSPAGMDFQLKTDQFFGFSPSPSELRSASMTLPVGLSINPDAADGQTACTDAQANFGSDEPGNCPDNSKIGTVEVHTPALDGPLHGSLYFGEPKPGNQYRVFMIFDGFGIHAKLFASVFPDPQTGQLSMNIVDLPQVPFEEFDLHLFASDRGLMATPTRCQLYPAVANFVAWNSHLSPQRSRPNLSLRSGPNRSECPGRVRPFNPRLAAGTSNAVAGAFSSFTLKLDRDDGDQFLGDLNFKMPPGFTGSLRGISYCPEAAIAGAALNLGRTEQANPSCPASSQVGTTNVAAGPGSHPFHAVGKMYLAGPFKGAPLSVVAMTPALAGPYDYGTVVVRVALHVDPLTAQVSAISDAVPSIIGGVPIRMRSIQVNIDRKDAQGRPNFTINPTNCDPLSVDSQGIGDEGTTTNFSSYFQVVNCTRLPFRPRMSIRQVDRRATARSDNPALQLDLTTRNGDANIKSISVTLPSAFEIAQNHLGNICSEAELAATQCAGRQQIGEATTETPLLDQPLTGPVYAVSGSGGLPRLAFILGGQVDLLPRADARTVKGGRLQTTVPVIPDAPIGHFHMTVFGGKHGYLANTRDLCSHRPIVRIGYVAQNGTTSSQAIRVKSPCGGPSARHKRHRS